MQWRARGGLFDNRHVTCDEVAQTAMNHFELRLEVPLARSWASISATDRPRIAASLATPAQ